MPTDLNPVTYFIEDQHSDNLARTDVCFVISTFMS